MAVNDDMFVSVSNAFNNFAVIMHPFRNATTGGPIRCNMRYNTTDRFVHSVAVVGIAKNSSNTETFILVFAAEQMSTMTPYVCIGIIAKSTCVNRVQCTNVASPGSHQEYFLIGVDSNGTFAYGFSSLFAFKLDIYNNQITLNLTTNAIWPSAGFIPHSIDVADTWAVVGGYGYGDEVKKNYAALACFVDLSIMINASCTNLTSETSFLVPSNVVSYNELYELSVSIRGRKIVIGVPRLSTVVFMNKVGSLLNVTNSHQLLYPDATSFGRVIDWADETNIAVLVENPSETIWSKSQIFVYDENSVTLTSPLFTFPNNQQILGSRLSRPSLSRFGITSNGNMAILTENGDILIIPVSPAGYVSTWINTTDLVFVFYYETKRCIGGTYKNASSLGPCQICPPRTYNPGILVDPILQCIPCSNSSSTSLCPLASLADVDSSKVPSYSQAVAYPETGDTTDMEDLLLKNVFQLTSNPRCLLISPLFWTLIVGGMCCSILLSMILIKLFGCEKCMKCRRNLKRIFMHTDFIGEGERWAGGLATVALFVLVGFSYWFSVSFIRRYPIEDIFEPANFACDQSLVNAQFSSSLQLLDIPKSQESQPMFNLLDSQTFYLTVELINSGFPCSSVTTQENFLDAKHVSLAMNCTRSSANGTTSITVSFPRHDSTVQINMTGPYWIGAIRLCIRGAGQANMTITLIPLDFCQFFSTPNKAIGRLTYIPIVFVKNINVTQGLSESSTNRYSGLWIPTFSSVELSDEEYYVEYGNYLRYTSSLTVLQVGIDERPFYLKNLQQPIVRTAELVFKDLLFTTLCIELFAFCFLITKLFIIPICRWISSAWKKYHGKDSKTHDSSPSTTPTSNPSSWNSENLIWNGDPDPSILEEERSKVEIKSQKHIERKYSVSNIELDSTRVVNRF